MTFLHLLFLFNFNDFKGKLTCYEGSSLITLSWARDSLTYFIKGFPSIEKILHKVFDALKDVLFRASLLYTLNYQRDYSLYLVDAISTIEMLLVQEDDVGISHPIYYLSQNLNDTEIRYTHIEKLALAVIQAI